MEPLGGGMEMPADSDDSEPTGAGPVKIHNFYF